MDAAQNDDVTTKGRRPVEGLQDAPPARAPAPHTQASLLSAITEAARDRDERSLRRLLARFAEQATIADPHALRDRLTPRPNRRATGPQ